jgi:hypothetical protein
MSSARLAHRATHIDSNSLIDHIIEESERAKNHRSCSQHTQGGSKKEGQTDEALAATSSESSKKKRRKGKCHNCGKPGHWAHECRSPKKEGEASTSTPSTPAKQDNIPVGSANVITDYEGDGFWLAEEEDGAHTPLVCAEPGPLVLTAEDELDELEDRAQVVCTDLDLGCAPPDDWVLEDETACTAAGATEDDGARVELYDSGATRHVSPFKDDFISYSPLNPPTFLNTANQQHFPAVGTRTLATLVPCNGQSTKFLLRDVLYAPAVAYTLVSLRVLNEEGYTMKIGSGSLSLLTPGGELVGQVRRMPRRLYKVTHSPESANVVESLSIMELHHRLGHIAVASTRKLVDSGAIIGVSLDPDSEETACDACVYARATQLPIASARITPPTQNFGDEIHTDVWGPSCVLTRQGRKYFITFTDDATRYTLTFLLHTKDEALKAYKAFESWVITQDHCKGIKVLHLDCGGEYLSGTFNTHLAAAGTARKLTPHDTPRLNSVTERLNRTLLERMQAFTHQSGLPKSLWGEVLRHATWLKNRTATRALDGKTPFAALYGRPPDLSGLRIWGCPVLMHDAGGSKLEPRAQEARWLGFDVETRAHRVYWPGPGNVTVERNIYFKSSAALEGEGLNIPTASSDRSADFDDPSTEDESTSESAPVPVEQPVEQESESAEVTLTDNPPAQPRRSQRLWKPSRIVRDLQAGEGVASSRPADPPLAPGLQVPGSFIEEHPEEEESGGVWATINGALTLLEDFQGLEHAFAAETADAEAIEPRTLAEAKHRPDWPLWEKAIEEELATLKKAGTWKLEKAPPGANIIGSKWVFKAKKDAAGNIACYKARLVAQGFSQIGGVDYDDTYAPVAKLASSRAIIVMANRLGLLLHQVDIKGAYLNGVLNPGEVLYMRHPPGYKDPAAAEHVLRLLKALYGLKQAGRRWYQFLVAIFTALGFLWCAVDQAMFFKIDIVNGVLTIVVVHVDDCTIAASTQKLIDEFIAGLRKHVEVTDLGELHWMLGLEIRRDRDARTIHLSQRAYIDSILRRYNLDGLKPLSTPMDTQVRLSSDQAPSTTAEFAIMRDVPYREAVGTLNWAALATCPDIVFAVVTVAHFAANPGPAHWEAVKRIYRYLAGTRNLWLSYGETRRTLEGYADTDGSMAEDRRAITGYTFLIDGGAVSWSSKRQEIVSLSTTESEYVAATHGMKEALWLRSLLSEVFSPFKNSTTLFSDNQAAIALTRDHQYHARTKHIDMRYHWIRWVIEQGSLKLIYCPTDDMVADALTKALPSAKVKHFAAGLGLCAK